MTEAGVLDGGFGVGSRDANAAVTSKAATPATGAANRRVRGKRWRSSERLSG